MDDQPSDRPFAYDEIAYPSPIVPGQTPCRIAAAGFLHGWRAPDPLTASVLEIGCGDGLNLIGIAAMTPRSRCTGFDLSRPAIEQGRAFASAAGVANVDLHWGDILTYPREGERFDYVICHGVYTWVPEFVRAGFFDLIAARLAPGGVAYVSFDCLPAAAPKAAIHEFLIAQLAGVTGVDERVAGAYRIVEALARNQVKWSGLYAAIKGLLEQRAKYEPHHFFHDWLAEYYAPVSMPDFAFAAGRSGLAVAGDTSLADIFSADLDAEARALVAAAPDAAGRCAILDLLRGAQTFRRSLLVHKDAPPPADADGLAHLRFAFLGEREEKAPDETDAIAYGTGDGTRLVAREPLERAVLDSLVESAPDELTLGAFERGTGASRADLETVLYKVAGMGLVECFGTPQNFVTTPGERPLAGALIRFMLSRSDWAITRRHLRSVASSDATRLLVMLCDGTRTRPELARDLAVLAKAEVTLELIELAIVGLALQCLFEA